MNTQDLVPILDEIQTHKEELNELHQQLDQVRQAYESLEQKSMHVNAEIRHLYAVIQYSIDHDMDPTQAKLTMSSDMLKGVGSLNYRIPHSTTLASLNTNLGAQLMNNSITAQPTATPYVPKSLFTRIFTSLKS